MNFLDFLERKSSACAISLFILFGSVTITLFTVVEPVSGDIPYSINEKVNNESAPANQYDPDVAVDSTGNIYIVWEDDRQFNSDIYFSKSTDNGVTWTDPDIKITNSSADQSFPSITISLTNSIYVAWEDERNSNSDIYFAKSTNFGVSWSDPNIQISNDSAGRDQRAPDIAVDATGDIYVVWEDTRNGDWDIYLAISSDNGATWSDPNIRVGTDTTYANQRKPCIALDSLGNIYVAWHDDRNFDRDIYFTKSEDQGATWFPDKRVSSDNLNQSQRTPTIAVDSSGIIYIAWQDNRNGDWDIYFANSIDGGGNWTNPNVRVNSDSGSVDQHNPSITVDLDDIIHIAWHDFEAGDSDIYYVNSTDCGATWLSPDLRVSDDVTGNIQHFPSIITYSNDRVYVVWEDKRANPYTDIYFASLEPIPTVDYMILTNSPGGNSLDNIDISVGGSVTIYASGYNLSSGRYVDLVEVSWSQAPPLGSLSVPVGKSTTFTAGLTPGSLVISGTSTTGPMLYDEFNLNILPPKVDYILITDVVNGSPLLGGIVPQNYQQWGYCSAYNDTAGFIGSVDADWNVDGGGASLLGPSHHTENGIDVGAITVRVWFNATYNGHIYSVMYSVSPWTVDYVEITDVPGGSSLTGGDVPVGFNEWGYCSAYNNTGGYIDTVSADWRSNGGSSYLLGPEPEELNGINVGIESVLVSFTATYLSYSHSVQYNVVPPRVDYIQITDTPGGISLTDDTVGVAFIIWGFCSAYNNTAGFIRIIEAHWTSEGGSSTLLGGTPDVINGIDVGDTSATVWFNASYNETHNYSVEYMVLPPTIDYIEITATPGGEPLSGGIVPINFSEWGYCSLFNNSIGYLMNANGNWNVSGGSSLLLGGTPAITNGIDVGAITTDIWFNVSFGIHKDSVLYNVRPPVIDSIEITDTPGGVPVTGDAVAVGYKQWVNCSVYNTSFGYMGTVVANWTVEGGSAFLLGTTPSIMAGINVGIIKGIVWLNVSYSNFSDSVQYTVLPPTIDYIDITDVPGGTPLKGGLVPFDFQQWGNCSAFNNTAGFIETFSANWTAEGGTSSLLGGSPSVLNGIKVGTTEVNVWLNATLGLFTDSVTYTVVWATIDYIDITYMPNGSSLLGGNASVGLRLWGNCSAYNLTRGYLGVVPADWTTVGGSSSLLNFTPSFSNGIDVGILPVNVWLNASYMGFTDSIQYSVVPPTMDYVKISDAPNGIPILAKTVPVGFVEWGFCSAYNNTAGFINIVDAQWTAEGGNSSLLNPSPSTDNGINVGLNEGSVWFNASFEGYTYTIQYLVSPPTIDYIDITDFPGGIPLTGGILPINYQEWGFCSAYNLTGGFIDVVNAAWSTFGGLSMLLGPSTSEFNGIDLGSMVGIVWFNASYGGFFNSIQYLVTELTLDYIAITDVPNGIILTGGAISIGERVWGNCSIYNNSIGYMGVGNATWTVEGGFASRLSSTHGIFNGVDVGTTPGDVWFNVSYGGFTYSVLFTVIPPSPDTIIIRDGPDNLGSPVGDRVYIVYQEEFFYAAGYNGTVGYIGDVEVSWLCDDLLIGNVDPQSSSSTTFKAQKIKVNGTCIVTASYQGVSDSTGVLLVVAPTIDDIEIRNGANGTGIILDSMTFSLNEQATFYAAGYNITGGFVEDLGNAEWEVENAIGVVTTPGAFTTFTALVYGTGAIKVSYTFDTTILTYSSGIITVIPSADTTAPSAPIEPDIKVIGKDKIEISWKPNTEGDLAGYRIYRRTSPDDDWILVATVDASTTTFTDSNLEVDTQYYYSITAFDDAEEPNESPYSEVLVATTKSEEEEKSPVGLILLAIIVVAILLLLILLFIRKSKGGKLPVSGVAWGYGVDHSKKPSEIKEETIEEKELSENEEEPPPTDDEDFEKAEHEEDKKEKTFFEDEEEPPPPDDEDEEPPSPDDE